MNSDPDAQKYLGGYTVPERCENSIKTWLKFMRDCVQWYYAAVDLQGQFVGVVTIIREGDDDGTYHLTLAVTKTRRDGGVGTAIVTEAVKMARQLSEVKSLVAIVEDENTGSRALFNRFDPNPTSEMIVNKLSVGEVPGWRYTLL